MDYTNIIARNEALIDLSEPVMLTPGDLGAIASLMQLTFESSFDGDDRNHAAQKLVSKGAIGAIHTVLALTEGMEQQGVFMAFDLIRDGATAGIIDLSFDYSQNPKDMQYCLQLHEFFSEVGSDYLLEDAHDEHLQEIATMFRTRGYEVDMESVVKYVSERSSFSEAGYKEYLRNHVAIREGSL